MGVKVVYENTELGFVNIDDTKASGTGTYSSGKIDVLLGEKQDKLAAIDGTVSTSNPVATKSTLNSALADILKSDVIIDFTGITETEYTLDLSKYKQMYILLIDNNNYIINSTMFTIGQLLNYQRVYVYGTSSSQWGYLFLANTIQGKYKINRTSSNTNRIKIIGYY